MPEYGPYAELRETHTGLVVLFGDRAYKVKKPLQTDFLDFSTPQLRELACAREVELNSRLAPDVYLGVAHLTDPTGGPDEPVVLMRRMPEQRRLSNTLDDPALSRSRLSALVQVLALFHHCARRGPEIDAEGRPDALRRRWKILLGSLADQPAEVADPHLVERIEWLAMRYIDGRESLLLNRIADGRVVDGHGDLLSEDIFDLADGFRVLDCLDFDDRLRYVDCLDDIAFLAMDLEFRGHASLGAQLLDDYLLITADPAPRSLRDHYVAYRALVRAKVDVIRFGQGDSAARDRVHRHLRIAVRHLESGAVRLVLVGGLPGTGKSTVAKELAASTGAVVCSSDEVRNQLRTAGTVPGDSGTFDAGAYSAANKARVYAELLARAHRLLSAGISVILDASWIDESERHRAAQLAVDTHADLLQLRCVCAPEVAGRRISRRGSSDSDATPHIAAAMSATAAPWPQAVVLDTEAPLADTVAGAYHAWQSAPETSRDFGHPLKVQLRDMGDRMFVG
ncbi:AAA family ATPase [Nocardia brasiliensis]|uniref:bifunctional aminoglycoside phosphotransferase/ATP-binding protein n=1 Tax=Nocardia brasiliensis TaxID=37326 RepID=UPI0024587BE5|nr:bifunctional aminoglycoside phosphotransferase/ATP-binding protein [Nocardia brasiliensis]